MTEQNIEHQSHHELLQQEKLNPSDYLSTVIELYRADEADYRGRRNEDQQLIAEYASEEADEYFDGTVLGLMSLASYSKRTVPVMPDEERQKEITLGDLEDGVSLYEMRNAWRQLWVGLNVLTNRLHRDSETFRAQGYPESFDMSEDNKKALQDTLFTNFQELNALRFGVKGSGVRRHKLVPDIDGGGEPKRETFDPDEALSLRGVANYAARRKYTAIRDHRDDAGRGAVHPAGKMTPNEFIQLRKEFPEVEMDQFAYDTAFLKDIAATYRSKE